MITTATTMMTDVVVAPSLGGLLVGCVLLLTRTVPVMVVVPAVWGGEVALTVWEGSGFDAVDRKHTSCMLCNKRHQRDGNIKGDRYIFRFMLA